MRIKWIASDGSSHYINADNMKEAQEKIAELRKKLGLQEPTLMLAQTDNEEFKKDAIQLDELSEDIKEQILESAQDTMTKANNKKLN